MTFALLMHLSALASDPVSLTARSQPFGVHTTPTTKVEVFSNESTLQESLSGALNAACKQDYIGL